MNMKKFLLISILLGVSGHIMAAQVSPTPEVDTPVSGTADGTAHVIMQNGSSIAGYRVDCFLQNQGTHTMYYAFGHTATIADKQLPPAGSMNCDNGPNVSSEALSLLGTSGDTYTGTEAFVRAQ